MSGSICTCFDRLKPSKGSVRLFPRPSNCSRVDPRSEKGRVYRKVAIHLSKYRCFDICYWNHLDVFYIIDFSITGTFEIRYGVMYCFVVISEGLSYDLYRVISNIG